jgi:hypothetical protein
LALMAREPGRHRGLLPRLQWSCKHKIRPDFAYTWHSCRGSAEVLDLFTTDEYFALREVITAFSEALGTSGLDQLERMVRERLDHAHAGKHDYRQRV